MHQDQRDHIMNPRNIKILMKIKISYLLMNLVNQLMTTYHGNQDKEIPAKKQNTKKKWKYLILVYGR